MGPYCNYCDNRCFVERVYPTEDGWRFLIMATCERGMANDREKTGYDFETAINPVTDPRFRKTAPEERIALVVTGVLRALEKDNRARTFQVHSARPGEIVIELPSFQPGVVERSFRLLVEETTPVQDDAQVAG